MLENEIINAVNCCLNKKCRDCYLSASEIKLCRTVLLESALDLLISQQAEIERLEKLLSQMGDYFTADFTKLEHNSLCETETFKVGE